MKTKPAAKHTQGPWTAAGYGILGPEGKLKDSIAVTSVRTRNGLGLSKFDDEERMANARLIAAAPDMKGVCDALIAIKISDPDTKLKMLPLIIDAARAAIAKAEQK